MTSTMRLGVTLYPYDRWPDVESILAAAQRAEELGFASVGLPEHVVQPTTPDASTPGRTNRTWYDNFVLASAIAARTHRITVHLSALIVPYRNPALTAKSLATLDVVSGGRICATVGAGWLRADFDVLGIPYEERGARTDEYLDAMRALWTMDEPEFSGEFVEFSGIAFEPKCVQRPHVPLLIGGSGRRILERVLRVGAGWAPMRGELEELQPSIDWLREHAPASGRDPDQLRFFTRIDVLGGDSAVIGARAHADAGRSGAAAADATTTIEQLHRYAEAGFTEIGLAFPWDSPAEFHERLEWIAEAIMPNLP